MRTTLTRRTFAVAGLAWLGMESAWAGGDLTGGDLTGGDLTGGEASGGLKEALSNGIAAAVASTGRKGGYFDNPAIKIPMPPKLQRVEQGMRVAGMGPKVDEFVHAMNAAAEEAAPAAKAILLNALKSMSIEDARGIVMGGHTAGTEYFKRTSSVPVSEAFRPIVHGSMAKLGVTQQFESLLAAAPSIPFFKMPTVDIDGYVLEKSVDGLFFVMGEEETKIRTNPAAQVTPLLRTVFGRR